DYWNELGWVDPFSSREWTARQNAYSQVLGNDNPYTPQMVVDGQKEFVGSQAPKARQAILDAGAQPKTQVALIYNGSGPRPGTETLSVKIGRLLATPNRDTPEVWLAVTETKLHSDVKRGENAGQDLHHAAIVRTIRKIGEAKYGADSSFIENLSVPLELAWKRENLRIVVFLQES